MFITPVLGTCIHEKRNHCIRIVRATIPYNGSLLQHIKWFQHILCMSLTKVVACFFLNSHAYNKSIKCSNYVLPHGRPGIKWKFILIFSQPHLAFNVLYLYTYLCIYVKPCWSVRPGEVQLGKAAGNATNGPNEPFAHPVSAGKKPSFSPSICPMSSLVPTVGLSRLLQHPDAPAHRFPSPSKFRTGTTTGTNGSSTLRRVESVQIWTAVRFTLGLQHSGTVYFATWGHEWMTGSWFHFSKKCVLKETPEPAASSW